MFPCRISVENIEVEFSSLYVRIKSLEEKVQGDAELLQQLEPFLQVKHRQWLCNTLYIHIHTYRKLDRGHCTSSGPADSSALDKDTLMKVIIKNVCAWCLRVQRRRCGTWRGAGWICGKRGTLSSTSSVKTRTPSSWTRASASFKTSASSSRKLSRSVYEKKYDISGEVNRFRSLMLEMLVFSHPV